MATRQTKPSTKLTANPALESKERRSPGILNGKPDLAESNEAARFRERILAQAPESLEARLSKFVVEGVNDGLVVVDPTTGYAVTVNQHPGAPSGREELEKYLREHPDWQIQRQRVQDLQFALEQSKMQIVALRAIGVSMVEVPMLLALVANGLALDAGLAGTPFLWCPTEHFEKVKPLLEAQLCERTGLKRAYPWAIALANLLSGPIFAVSVPSNHSRASFALELLRFSVAEIPTKLREPDAAQLAEANEFLSTLRVSTVRVDAYKPSRKVGPRLGPWGAAVRFAACFGLHLPDKEAHVRR